MMFLKIIKCTTGSLTLIVVVWIVVYGTIHWPNKPCFQEPKSKLNLPNESHVYENYSVENTSRSLYVITPTYHRPTQIVEMVKMAQTLMLVNNVCWIVVEDTITPTEEVVEYLKITSLNYIYLTAQMPSQYRDLKTTHKPRGVANRLAGLKWIRENVDNGVFYFADDDNTYDIRLFNDIRNTEKVSMFPVGFIGKYGVSSPIIKNGKVTGFFDSWIGGRKYAVDMAGFAVNIKYFKQFTNASMPYKAGQEEDGFLRSLQLSFNDIEPKAINCTKIWVWHTRTKTPQRAFKPGIQALKKIENSNISELIKKIHK